MDNRVEIVLAAKDITGKAFAKVQGRLKSLSKAVFSFNGALAGVAGAAGVGYFIKKNLEAADSIAKIADSVGVSTKSLQEYRFVAERSGVATSQLDQGLGAFSKRLGELKAGTGALNTMLNKNNEALKNQLIAANSTDEALNIFLTTLAGIENQSEKTALSAAAFSRTAGIKMTNLVKNGTAGLAAMKKEFADLGIAIDEKFLRQSEKAVDQFTNLEYVIKSRLMGAVVQAAPEITKLVGEMTNWVTVNDDLLKQKIPVYINNTKIAAKGVYDALEDIKSIYDAIPDELKGPTGVGLLGCVLFGPKAGVVIGGMSYLVGEFKDFADGIKGLMDGQISLDEFIGDEKKFEEALERYRQYKKDMMDIDNKYPIGSHGNPDELHITKYPKIPPIMNITENFEQPYEKAMAVHNESLAADWKSTHEKMYADTKRMSDLSSLVVYEYQEKAVKVGENITSSWSNAFDGWANDFARTMTDVVWGAEFSFKNIATSYGKMLTQMVIQKDILEPSLSFLSGESGGSGLLSSIGGLVSGFFGGIFGGGTGATTLSNGAILNPSGAVFGMADGGVIDEHILGIGMATGKRYQFGEGGQPEAVIPKKNWGKQSGSGTTNNIFIQAVDAKSFDDLVKKNPGSIVSVVDQAISENGSLRQTIGATL